MLSLGPGVARVTVQVSSYVEQSYIMLNTLPSFILGITEALFYPGAIYMVSLFYTRKGSHPNGHFLYGKPAC